MKKSLIVVTALLAAACQRPALTAPSHVEATQTLQEPPTDFTKPWRLAKPLHHNIPVTLPDGRYGFVCETQVRPYFYQNTGQTLYGVDHYVIFESTGCPETPID